MPHLPLFLTSHAEQMKVKVLKSFAGPLGRGEVGEVITLPEGADWIKAGFVEPVSKPASKAPSKPASRKGAKLNPEVS